MMRFDDLRVEARSPPKQSRRCLDDLLEDIDAEREVARCEQSPTTLGHEGAHVAELRVPPSRSNDDWAAIFDNLANVPGRGCGRCEYHCNIGSAKSIAGNAVPGLRLVEPRHDFPASRRCELVDDAPHLSHADDR